MNLSRLIQSLNDGADPATIPDADFADVFSIAMLRSDDEGFADPSPLQTRLYAHAIRLFDEDSRMELLYSVSDLLTDDPTIHPGTLYAWLFLEPDPDIVAEAALILATLPSRPAELRLSPLLQFIAREDISPTQRAAAALALTRLPSPPAGLAVDALWKSSSRALKTALLAETIDPETPDANWVLFLADALESRLFPSFKPAILKLLKLAGENVDAENIDCWPVDQPASARDTLPAPDSIPLPDFQNILLARLDRLAELNILSADETTALKRAWTEVL